MTTVAIADDHAVVRDGLRAILAAEPDISIAGEAADGLEALRLVERAKPDVLVLDAKMPGLSGVDVLREVTSRFPETRVVLLSMHSSEALVVEALRAGAGAFVPKEAGAAEVKRAVREVAAGRRYLAPPLSERAIEAYLFRPAAPSPDPYESLTTREREVLLLAAEGLKNPEIGRRLFISPRTVESHRASIQEKLGLKSNTDLVRYAIRKGLLPLEN